MDALRLFTFALLASLASTAAFGFFAAESTWEAATEEDGCILMTPFIDFIDRDMLIISSVLRFIHVTDESVARDLRISPEELRFEVFLAHPYVEEVDLSAIEPPTSVVIDQTPFEPFWIPDAWHVVPSPETSANLLQRLSTGNSVDLSVSTDNHSFSESLSSERFKGFEDALATFNLCRSSDRPDAAATALKRRPSDA